jgi:hypothetical protein
MRAALAILGLCLALAGCAGDFCLHDTSGLGPPPGGDAIPHR